MLVQLAAESVETKDQAHIQQGKEGEFEAVLTKYLGQAKNTPEPKGEEELEAEPQENRAKKEASPWFSLASVFVPINGQNSQAGTLEAETSVQVQEVKPARITVQVQPRAVKGLSAEKENSALAEEVELPLQTVPRPPEHRTRLETGPRAEIATETETLPVQLPSAQEQQAQVAELMPRETAPEMLRPGTMQQTQTVEAQMPDAEESAPALSPSQDLPSISEQVTVLTAPETPDAEVRPAARQAEGELKRPETEPIDSAAVSAVQALPEESEAFEMVMRDPVIPVRTGVVTPDREEARTALRSRQAAETKHTQELAAVQHTSARGEGQEASLPETAPTIGDGPVKQDIQPPKPQQTGAQEAFAKHLEGLTGEISKEAPRQMGSGEVELRQPVEVSEEEIPLPETEEHVPEAPIQVRASREQRLEVQGERLTAEPRLNQRDTKERPVQGQTEAVPSPDVGAFESAAELAEAESPVRKILDFADRENLFPKLVQTMETIVQEERTEVRIQLKPDHLGELKIKLSMERGIMVAEFIVENQAVREVIASQLPQLQTALQDHGTQVADLSVSIGFGEARPDEQGQPNQRQSGRQTQRRLDRMTAANSEKAYSGRSIWNQVDVRA